MDLKQLRYFVSIAKIGSITQASKSLHVAQPALSAQMANLEAELGVRLLERSARGVKPTSAGSRFLAHAEGLLAQAARARSDLLTAGTAVSGAVRIALPSSVASSCGFALVRQVHGGYPGIALEIVEGVTRDIREWVRAGGLDFGVVYDLEQVAQLSSQQLLRDPICLIGPAGSLPATIDFAKAARLPLLLPSRTQPMNAMIRSRADALGRELNVVAELAGLNTIMQCVTGKLGYAIVPASSVCAQTGRARVAVARMVRPSLVRDVGIVSLTTHHTRAAEIVRAVLSRIMRRLQAKIRHLS
ncbi:MAG: LysR family transcriptional regulator [Rhodospirillaceae bacterium]|nr:LysR family transcriptional regulator [Rhodospirillaceae bacterium]